MTGPIRHSVSTSDPDEADVHMQAYTRFRAEPVTSDDFEFGLHTTSTGLMSIGTMRHTARFRAHADPPAALTISEAVEGAVWVDHRREQTRGPLVLVPYRSPYLCGWDDVTLRMTTIDLAEVHRIGAELTGLDHAGLDFGQMEPLSPAHARYWSRLTGYLDRDVFADDEAMAMPLVRANTLRQLITCLLTVFPNTTHAVDRARERHAASPVTVRRAVGFMDTHAAGNIGLTEIAEAARVGTRGLQYAFRAHLGCTPLGYLRRVRMEHAHHNLRDADPTRGDTIAAIAARWGFTHAGRFSVDYRAAYGCSPSETLRRDGRS